MTALFIASKYEEIYPPELADCTHITDDAYKADEILAMEMTVLRGPPAPWRHRAIL